MFKLEKANAYSALIGAAAGTLATFLAAVFFLGGQWERWTEIRDAHLRNEIINKPIDLTPYADTDSLPDFSDFALKTDIPSTEGLVRISSLPDFDTFAKSDALPSLVGYARSSDIPDVSGFLTTTEFNNFLNGLGRGATNIPRKRPDSSRLCPEGSVMVGVEYEVATGGNAGALYHGIEPICRLLTR